MVWIGKQNISDIRERGTWKVEFFSNDLSGFGLPAYPLVPVSQIAAERRELLTPEDFPGTLFNFLGLENVESLSGSLVGDTRRKGNEIKSRCKVFREGDILYGRLRPYLNKVYAAEYPVSEGICSGEFFVLIPNTQVVLPRYLRELLSSDYVQRLSGWITGSTLPRLQLDDLFEVRVPIADIETQRKFVDFLAEAYQEKRKLRGKFENLAKSVHEAFMLSVRSGMPLKYTEVEVHDDHEYLPLPPGDFSIGRRRK